MTLEDFRLELNAWWIDARLTSTRMKDPYWRRDELVEKYEAMSATERQMTHAIASEWILSEDRELRSDGLMLARRYRFPEARPALVALAEGLSRTSGPAATHELERVNEILNDLV